MFKLFSHHARCVGIDIGESSIKMAEVRKNGSDYQLVNFGVHNLEKAMEDGEFRRDSDALSAGINRLVPAISNELPKIAVAMSGQNVFIRYITLPPMTQKEMGEAVSIEAESLFPMPISEAALDFIKIGEAKEDSVTKDEIMVVAARKAHVQQLAHLISHAGLEPAVVDIESLALLRTVNALNISKSDSDTIAMVDIGTNDTTVSIFKGQALRFTRTISFGGFRLTKVLMDTYNMSYEEAEGTKRLMVLGGTETDSGLNVLLHQKAELIGAHVENMVLEISRSVEFYQSRYRGEAVSKILISGGVAQMKGMAEFIQDSLDMEVKVINPIEKMVIAPELKSRKKEIEEAGTSLAVVIGLALSEVN